MNGDDETSSEVVVAEGADRPAAAASSPAVGGHRRVMMFAVAAVVVAAGVVSVGWFTDLRQVLYAGLAGLVVVAFLPFVIIAGGIAIACLFMGLSVVVALLGGEGMATAGGGEGVAEVGVGLVGPYYRWLGRRRHPMFWGSLFGVPVGTLVVWIALASLVVPGESTSAGSLYAARDFVEGVYERTKRYPAASAEGWLVLGDGAVARDGFGRPLRYAVDGRWRVASYRLRSDGYDGRAGTRDDLCIAGATKLGWAAQAFRVSRDQASGRVSVRARLAGIQELRCGGTPAER